MNPPASVAGSTNLTADAVKGSTSITVTSTAGFSVGQDVLLDELSGASWQTDVQGHGQIWASPDFRVVWQMHNPFLNFVDDDGGADATGPFDCGPPPGCPPVRPPAAMSWFGRVDRPTNEIKEIASISGNTITFSTPIHISYRTSHTAQLSFYSYTFVKNAGLENVKVVGADDGAVRIQWCSQCWVKQVDISVWGGEGVSLENSFRPVLRDSYIHDAAVPEPGGGAYAISLCCGASEALVENNIVVRTNKDIVARSSGAGSVVGYNYMDESYIDYNGAWIEVGVNGSHLVGSHQILFEGNYSHNYDSDMTHGNSIYMTVFRNHLRGIRAPFTNQADGTTINDASDLPGPTNGPKRCAGGQAYSYWHSFAGNVLGLSGAMTGWVYETTFANGTPGIWLLGWDSLSPYPVDANVKSTAYRHGNWDYVQNAITWDPTNPNHTLPNSLYLSAAPTFFTGGASTWPWVQPDQPTKLFTLPAKARFDAGTPFTQPP
jgi:hypothetical protein